MATEESVFTEFLTLKAIYGDDLVVHEGESYNNAEVCMRYVICDASICFKLLGNYPNQTPSVSLICDMLPDQVVSRIESETMEYMQSYTEQGEPYLYQSIEFVSSLLCEHSNSLDAPNSANRMLDPCNATRVSFAGECSNKISDLCTGNTISNDLNQTCEVNSEGSVCNKSSSSSSVEKNKLKPCPSSSMFTSGHLTDLTAEVVWICVVQLDHMRNERLYMKNMKQWSNRHAVSCTLLDSGRCGIIGIVVGVSRGVDAFMQTWRTQHVDVDSKGRSCKERRMTVLCKAKYPDTDDMTDVK